MTIRMLVRSACLAGAAAALVGCVAYVTPEGQTTPRPAPPPPPAARPPAAVDVGFFYDALDPDGDWLSIEPYGWVWVPNGVDPFWRPYTVGRWEWTDWGWTWVSAERWGWATYHYGRWVRVNRQGWAWVPGDVWGPAWVAWRHGPGVVGWAPLPPEARFRTGIGLDWGGIDIDVAIRLDAWCFLDDGRLVDSGIDRYAYPVGRNVTVIRGTRDATRFRVVDRRIINEGIDRGEIERSSHRAIQVRRVVDNPRADRRSPEIAGEEVRVYRPDVRPGPPTAKPSRPSAPAPHPSVDPGVEDNAERRWDRRWTEDWHKLDKAQRRDEPAAPAPPAPPRPEVLQKQRDENYEAAENAHRELVAERERATRRAVREPQGVDKTKEKDKGKKKDK